MRWLALAVFGAATLGAGAHAYAASGPGADTATPGFTDERIDASHFRVSFAGAAEPSRPQVERYLLYRAADLTVGEGYDWFEMAVPRASGGRAWRPAWKLDWRQSVGGAWKRAWGPYDTEHVVGYEATVEILVGRGPAPGDDPRAFDARQVMTGLGAKVVQPS